MRIDRFVNLRRLALAAPILALLGLGLWFFLRDDSPASTPRAVLVDTPLKAGDDAGVRRGQLARDFLVRGPDGGETRLSDLRARPTIINFWATWCASCAAEMPDFKGLQQEMGPDRLNVLAVNAGEDSATAQDFLDWLDAPSFRTGMDPSLVVADAYGVFGLPYSVFVDASGVIRATYAGQLSPDLMREYVQAASDGETTEDPPPKLRLVTTVARDHVLEVETVEDGVEFRSKSLRCDDTYCAEPVIAELESRDGVESVRRYVDEDPPRIVVSFDASSLSQGELTDVLFEQLKAHADPLYERPLEVDGP